MKILSGFNGAQLAGEGVTGDKSLWLAYISSSIRADKYYQAFKRQQKPGRGREFCQAPQH
jgi:hypothetical protein